MSSSPAPQTSGDAPVTSRARERTVSSIGLIETQSKTTFREQTDEYRDLINLYRSKPAGALEIVILEGPHGASRSRMTKTFAQQLRLDGGVLLEGHCADGRPFGPFVGIVERALGLPE